MSDCSSATVAILLAYNGAPFHGFARQEGCRTVQGELESALETLAHRRIETVGAGRTDAGVHATGQVVSATIPASLLEAGDRVVASLNALTPPAMVVRGVSRADDSFNARFDARARTYLYRIAQTPGPPVFMAPYCWYIAESLESEAMQKGADRLIGEHDFSSFCVARSARDLLEQDRSTSREITAITCDYEEIMGERMLTVTVAGNAFLHSMVRVIVGTLVEVGRGARPLEWVDEVLKARDRTQAGQTAPAQGLMLHHIDY